MIPVFFRNHRVIFTAHKAFSPPLPMCAYFPPANLLILCRSRVRRILHCRVQHFAHKVDNRLQLARDKHVVWAGLPDLFGRFRRRLQNGGFWRGASHASIAVYHNKTVLAAIREKTLSNRVLFLLPNPALSDNCYFSSATRLARVN